MHIPIIRTSFLAGLAMLMAIAAANAGDGEEIPPSLEKRLEAIEKKVDAAQYTFDQILKRIDDVLWFERVGDVASWTRFTSLRSPIRRGRNLRHQKRKAPL